MRKSISILKGHLKITHTRADEKNLSDSLKGSQYDNKSKKTTMTNISVKSTVGLVHYNSELDDSDCKFDIFKKCYLEHFENPLKLKCRVYILRCMNLGAKSSNVNIH